MECKNYPNCDTNFSHLIEQQAERIKKLEGEVLEWQERSQKDTSIISERNTKATKETKKRLQAELRIKELEAEKAQAIKERDAFCKVAEHRFEYLQIATKELATLRQRIADAPVVALVVDDPHAVGWTKTRMLQPCVDGTKLISKEDLLK